MNDDVSYRILETADAEAFRYIRLLGLKTDASAFGSNHAEEAKEPLKFFQDRCTETGNSMCFGAFVDKSLVGITALVRETSPKTQHHANVYSVYVHSDFRGRGISSQLLENCINQAQLWQGVEYLQLGVSTQNTHALNLYLKKGFKTWGTQPAALRIEGIDYDEHLMALKL